MKRIKNRKWWKFGGVLFLLPLASFLIMCKNQEAPKTNQEAPKTNKENVLDDFDANIINIENISKPKFINQNKTIINLKLKKFNFKLPNTTITLTYKDNNGHKFTSDPLSINDEQNYDFIFSNLTPNRKYQIQNLTFNNQKRTDIYLKTNLNNAIFSIKPIPIKTNNFKIKVFNQNALISFSIPKNSDVRVNEKIALEFENLSSNLVPNNEIISRIDKNFNVEFKLDNLKLNNKYRIVNLRFLDTNPPNVSPNIFEKLSNYESSFTIPDIKTNMHNHKDLNTNDKKYIDSPYNTKIELNDKNNFNDKVLPDAFEQQNINIQEVENLNQDILNQNELELQKYFSFISDQANLKDKNFQNYSFNDINKNSKQEIKFKIKHINIDSSNKKAIIELDSSSSNDNTKLLEANNKQLLIKSYDYNNPWSKIVSYEKKDNNKIIFDLHDFPKDLKTFIITHIRFDDNITSLGKIKENSFEYYQNDKEYLLKSLKYYFDIKENQLYGSACFNFNNDDFKILKNKTFVFKYEIDTKNNILNKYIPLNKYINVDFKNLAQFKIVNVFDGLNYKLESIKIVNKNSLLPYNDHVNIQNANNTNFSVWHKVYPKQNIINEFFDDSLIKDEFNLSKIDFNHLWKNNTDQKNIPYSLRNLISLTLHEREYAIYKHNATNGFYLYNTITSNKDFNLIKNNKESYHLNSLIAHLAIKDEGLKKDESAGFFLEKDLNDFDNLNNFKDEDIVFNVDLELDPNLIYESQLVDKNMRRSHVIIPISYKVIKKQHILEDVEFSLNYALGSEAYENHIYQQIKSQLKFNVFLNGSKIKVEVKPRNDNIKLYDYVWKHNNSNQPSYFIGRYDFIVNWLTNNNEVIIDKKLEEFKKKSYTARILKDNENEMSKAAIKQVRERTITFSLTSDGTWNFLGKVKPNDPNDYRYYMLTDHHVIGSGGSWYNPQINWAGKMEYESINLNKKTIYDDDGNEKYTYSNFADYTVVIPQTISQNDLNKDKYQPYYNYSSVNNQDTPGKNQLQYFAFPFKLKFEKVMDFCLQKNNIYKHYNALGRYDDKISELDWSVVSIDLKPIFEAFKNQDLNKPFIYNNKTLSPEETSVIKYFLSLKNIKPLEVSPQTRYVRSNQDVDWYIGTFPRYTNTNQNSMGVGELRYREYNIQKIDSVNTNFVTGGKGVLYKSDIPYTTISTDYIDAAGGSSGTSLYDEQGRFVGSIATGRTPSKNGHPTWETIGWSLIDSQISGFFGDRENRANNSSIIQQIKQLAYLYPEKYEDIYK